MANGIERIKGMLGFAMRAGRVILGTELILSSMSVKGNGRARLVIVSTEASDATRSKLEAKGRLSGVPVIAVAIGMEELGRLLGKTYAPCAVAISDDGFASQIVKAQASEIISGKEVSEIGNGN